MAVVRNLMAVQESMLKSIFESTIQTITTRVDELVKSLANLKESLEYSQNELEDLKPLAKKMEDTESELHQVQDSLEYLENQSRRSNIRLSGIEESAGETWNDTECKVLEVVEEKLDIDFDIERAHRVDKRKQRKVQKQDNRPRTIVCKLKSWKQREEVIREARKAKPTGLYIAEDLARATLLKREKQMERLKQARADGKRAYFILDRLIIKEHQ